MKQIIQLVYNHSEGTLYCLTADGDVCYYRPPCRATKDREGDSGGWVAIAGAKRFNAKLPQLEK